MTNITLRLQLLAHKTLTIVSLAEAGVFYALGIEQAELFEVPVLTEPA